MNAMKAFPTLRVLRRSLFAGLLAGLIMGILFFVDYGPGNALRGIAGYFLLDQAGTGKLIGFLLLIALGGLFGLIFGALQGKREMTIGRCIGLGLTTGVIYWLIVALLIGTIINHARLDLGSFLFSFVLLLVYGLLLGTISFQRTPARAQ
jgi:hypothetical protein